MSFQPTYIAFPVKYFVEPWLKEGDQDENKDK